MTSYFLEIKSGGGGSPRLQSLKRAQHVELAVLARSTNAPMGPGLAIDSDARSCEPAIRTEPPPLALPLSEPEPVVQESRSLMSESASGNIAPAAVVRSVPYYYAPIESAKAFKLSGARGQLVRVL